MKARGTEESRENLPREIIRFAKQGLGEMAKRETLLRATKERKFIERPGPGWAEENRKK